MTEYTILSMPCSIHVNCPYCDEENEYEWDEKYWDTGVNEVKCKYCGEKFKLGDWEYD